ncbi:MAG TPA: methyltransferase [Thermoanaerobaculia bacterium]|nr:methyltransferase [Thermoanaerobaculia bacterium]
MMESLAKSSADPTLRDAGRALDARPLPVPARLLAGIAMRLRRWLLALADQVVPAPVALFEQLAGHMQTPAIGAVARRRIADLLAAGPLSAAELAARTGLDADRLRRTMRGLATVGIFARDADGRFRNNRKSAVLLSGAAISLRDCAAYFSSRSHLHAWADFERTLESGQNAFERVHGMSSWDWFDTHPEEGAVFAGTMVGLTRLLAPGIAAAYPFAEIDRLCDVGGGHGTLLAEVLLRHQRLRGVLFDSAAVLADARLFLAARGIAEPRVELVAGSFFEQVPAGCDAYLLKNVLHDWDDERALRILGNCRRAMLPGHRLLVVESVVEDGTTRGHGPLADLQMMVVCCEGRERGRGELADLFARSGFRLARVLPMPGPVSVIEGRAV